MSIPELLAPAGGMAQLQAALRFGADAVYGALPDFGLRAFAGNFSWAELAQALSLLHGAGKKFYLTLNILPYDDEMDALTAAARRAWEMGAERVVLARELSLARIRALRRPTGLQLEAFVHGAMCMSYSGRCMLSDHLTGRGGNRGACAQPCRWEYALVEKKRPGEYIPVQEDEKGTYLLSAYDLCMLEHLPALLAAGIESLKIEGRMKTEYYVATVVGAYRRALDALAEGEARYAALLPDLRAELMHCSHRASNTGFYFGAPQPASGAAGFSQDREYVARVEAWAQGQAQIQIKNRFFVGDTLELLSPRGVFPFQVQALYRADTGEAVQTLSVAGQQALLPLPFPAAPGDFLRGPNRNHK